jgi:hypothetical protein
LWVHASSAYQAGSTQSVRNFHDRIARSRNSSRSLLAASHGRLRVAGKRAECYTSFRRAVFLDKYGALASATIYTLLLCAIFYLNKERVLRALQALIPDAGSEWAPKGQRVKIAIAALVAIGLLLALDQMLVNLLGYGKG